MDDKSVTKKKNKLKLIAAIALFSATALSIHDQPNLLIQAPSFLPLMALCVSFICIIILILDKS